MNNKFKLRLVKTEINLEKIRTKSLFGILQIGNQYAKIPFTGLKILDYFLPTGRSPIQSQSNPLPTNKKLAHGTKQRHRKKKSA